MVKARKSSNGSVILVGIIFTIIGLCFAIPGVMKLNKIKSGNLLNLNEASKSDFKSGEFCELTLDYYGIYGCYAQYEETTNYVFKRITHEYYLVDAGADYAYHIGVKVAKGTDLDSLLNIYNDSSATKTVTFTGVLRKQTGDAQKFYEEYIEDMYNYWYDYDLTAQDWAEIHDYSLPFYLEIVSESSAKSSIAVGFIMAIIGLFITVICIAKIAKAKNTSNSTIYGAGNYDPNTFGNYSGNEMNAGNPYNANPYDANPYNANPYGGDPTNQPRTPYSPGDAAINNGQANNPYQDPFYQQQQTTDTTDTTDGSSSGSFTLKD